MTNSKESSYEKVFFQLKLSKRRKDRWREWARREEITLSEAVREAMRRMIEGEPTEARPTADINNILELLDEKFSRFNSMVDQQFDCYAHQIQTEREERVKEQSTIRFSQIEAEKGVIQQVADRIVFILKEKAFQKPDQVIRTVFADLFNRVIEKLEGQGRIGQDRGGNLFLREESV